MAESIFSNLRYLFKCTICLDIPNNLVTIPCGHSFCLRCLDTLWDHDIMGICRCPHCRKSFSPRPVTNKNIMLTEGIETLNRTFLQPAEPGDVKCDICTVKNFKAIKFCLQCLVSCCPFHLQQHEILFKAAGHKLEEPNLERLQDFICLEHNKPLEIYCRTDQRFICYLCTIDLHKKHLTVSTAAVRTRKQDRVLKNQMVIKKMIHEKEKLLQKLRGAVKFHKSSAKVEVDNCEAMLTKLVRFVEKSCSEVTRQIRIQENAEVSHAEQHLELLKKEIDDLKKTDTDMEQVIHSDHYIEFHKSFTSLSDRPEPTNATSVISHLHSCEFAAKSVSELRDKLMDVCKKKHETFKTEKLFEILHCDPKSAKPR